MLNAAALFAFAMPANADFVMANGADKGTVNTFINTYNSNYGAIYANGDSSVSVATSSINFSDNRTDGRAIQTSGTASISLGSSNTTDLIINSNGYGLMSLGGTISTQAKNTRVTGPMAVGAWNGNISIRGDSISLISNGTDSIEHNGVYGSNSNITIKANNTLYISGPTAVFSAQ